MASWKWIAFIQKRCQKEPTSVRFKIFFLFDREQRSKVLKEALLLLLLLLLVWNQVTKMYQIEQKLCKQGNKKCAREQKMCKGTKNVLLWHIKVLNCRVCLVWLFVAFCGLLWPYVSSYGVVDAFYRYNMAGIVWSSVVLYGLLWPCMTCYGLVWPVMALYRLVRSFYGLIWHFMFFYGRI